MDKNQSYFMRRAAQERSAADNASGHAARDAHLELERRYRQLVGRRRLQEVNDPASV
jgi:transcription elongation GreA/GreB family factor